MNEKIRVSGKTVNDAIMNAAIELNTTSDRIDYTVLEHESRGFLGIGAKDAVIEASVRREDAEEKKGTEEETDSEKKEISTENPKKEESFSSKNIQASPADSDPGSDPGSQDETAVKEGDIKESGSQRKKNTDIKVLEDPSEAISRAETFLKNVLSSMNMDVSVSSDYDGECLNISMEGEETGILIGKRGQTLDSLQYLTSLVVNKGKPYYVRVKLDTENYRERRKATLENLAKNIAVKVKKTRQPVYLEPMNPYERRIIHSALQGDPFVTTHSEGEEPERKVVVTLKKDADLDLLERKYGERNRRGGYRSSRGGYGRGGRGGYGHSSRSSYRRDHDIEDSYPSEIPESSKPSETVKEEGSEENS